MHTQPEGFLAETVDEQIEQLALADRNQHPTPAVGVVQDLQELYTQGDSPAQVRRSLDAIWSRLADQISPANQTLFFSPATDPVSPIFDSEPVRHPAFTLSAGQDMGNRQMENERASGRQMALPPTLLPKAQRRSARRTLVMSLMAAVVLLSVFSWVMVTQLAARHSTALGGGPGTVTATPIAATPAPQSLRDQAQQLLNQFHQEVTAWGNTHQYTDKSNGKSYPLDYAYDQQGIGGSLDHTLSQASSQAAIDLLQSELTNLHAMETNYNDPTPFNQAHSTDSSLLSHYKLNSGVVIVVSLLEQSMRVYQNGQLLKAFQITTGRYEAPTLPGSWQILQHQGPVTLKSAYPQSSPYWFPPTTVHYALGFHGGGYLICDSWWRANYGPGTQFPHYDSSGEAIAGNGSTGSVNVSEADMAGLYNLAQVNTSVIVY